MALELREGNSRLNRTRLKARSLGGQQLIIVLAFSDGEALSTHTWGGTRLTVYFVRENKGASARTLYLQHRLDSSCIVLCGVLLHWCNYPMVDDRTPWTSGIHAYCGARAKGFALVFSYRLGLSCIVGCPFAPRQGTTIRP